MRPLLYLVKTVISSVRLFYHSSNKMPLQNVCSHALRCTYKRREKCGKKNGEQNRRDKESDWEREKKQRDGQTRPTGQRKTLVFGEGESPYSHNKRAFFCCGYCSTQCVNKHGQLNAVATVETDFDVASTA